MNSLNIEGIEEDCKLKPYFCIWFDEEGQMHERFVDTFAEAFDEARSCDGSELRYHWGDTQLYELNIEEHKEG